MNSLFDFDSVFGREEIDKIHRAKMIEEFSQANDPIIRTTIKTKKCKLCKKKLKRKHIKYIFRIVKEGKRFRRTYCEDCVDELTQEEIAKMEYLGSE